MLLKQIFENIQLAQNNANDIEILALGMQAKSLRISAPLKNKQVCTESLDKLILMRRHCATSWALKFHILNTAKNS